MQEESPFTLKVLYCRKMKSVLGGALRVVLSYTLQRLMIKWLALIVFFCFYKQLLNVLQGDLDDLAVVNDVRSVADNLFQ